MINDHDHNQMFLDLSFYLLVLCNTVSNDGDFIHNALWNAIWKQTGGEKKTDCQGLGLAGSGFSV